MIQYQIVDSNNPANAEDIRRFQELRQKIFNSDRGFRTNYPIVTPEDQSARFLLVTFYDEAGQKSTLLGGLRIRTEDEVLSTLPNQHDSLGALVRQKIKPYAQFKKIYADSFAMDIQASDEAPLRKVFGLFRNLEEYARDNGIDYIVSSPNANLVPLIRMHYRIGNALQELGAIEYVNPEGVKKQKDVLLITCNPELIKTESYARK